MGLSSSAHEPVRFFPWVTYRPSIHFSKNSPVEIATRLVMGEAHGTIVETILKRGLAAESFVDDVGKEIRLDEFQMVVCTSCRALVEIVPEVEGLTKVATLQVETVPEAAELDLLKPVPSAV